MATSNCYFCQEEVKPEDAHELKTPEGSVRLFCRECSDDMLEYFKSGCVERLKLNPNGGLPEARLGLTMGSYPRRSKNGSLVELGRDNKPIKLFYNFDITDIEREYMMNPNFYPQPSFNSNYLVTPSSRIQTWKIQGFFTDEIKP